MIAPEPKPAASYVRRSTDRQEQSLGDQRKEIARWAAENGYRLMREFVDDAISGTTARARPGFQQMITEAQKGGFEAVVVYNSDRFSRGSVTETEHYRYLLQQAGVSVLSVTEDYLADEGIAGDVMRAVKQFQNRSYSVSLSQVTLRGQLSAVLKASEPGRRTPFGYDREIVAPDGTVQYRLRFTTGGDRQMLSEDGRVIGTYGPRQTLRKPGKESTARLVLSDEERVQVVRDIFSMCVDGWGFKTIADALNRRGVMSPHGMLWQHTTIKAMVQNPVYRGDIAWNRRSDSKFYQVRNGRADKMRPTAKSGRVEHLDQDDWIVVKDAVPAIVSREVWDKAQAAAAKRSDCEGGRGRRDNRWLLSAVTKCAACGHPYWGVEKRKGHIPGRKPIKTSYYICSGRCRSGKSVCPHSAHVRADALEAWVLAQLQRMVLSDAGGVEAAIKRFVEVIRGAPAGPDSAGLEREIAQIDATVNTLIIGLDPANLTMINDRLTQLRRRKEYLQQQLRTAKSDNVDETAIRTWAAERINLLAEMAAGRRDEAVRRVLASYIDEIRIDPATKTGVLVVNANIAALGSGAGAKKEAGAINGDAQAPLGGSSETDGLAERQNRGSGQNDRDPAGAGSQVTGIAGARYARRLHRPLLRMDVSSASVRSLFWDRINTVAA